MILLYKKKEYCIRKRENKLTIFTTDGIVEHYIFYLFLLCTFVLGGFKKSFVLLSDIFPLPFLSLSLSTYIHISCPYPPAISNNILKNIINIIDAE